MPLIEDAEFAPFTETPHQVSPETDPTAEFDERHREDFTGLLFLGALTKKFTIDGHKFVIRTLRNEDVLAIGLATKEYMNTAAWQKAYTTAVVACVLSTADGRPLETPFREESAVENIKFRMDLVSVWSPFLIDLIYNEYLTLDTHVNEIFEAMGKASG